MSSEITVLIADDNTEFGDLLNEYISQHDDIRVVGIARDGLETLEMIHSLSPDVVVLDIIMPNLDGIGVLEKMASNQLKKKPLFIMLSAIGQDVFVQKAVALGAEYYIVKPFDVDILVSRIRQICKEKHSLPFSCKKVENKVMSVNDGRIQPARDLEIEVTNLMRESGIPPHMIGYQYIREAVLQAINNPKNFSPVTKILYPSIAQKFNTTPQKVERAIRNAIDSAWTKTGVGNHGETFANNRTKPTNSELIAVIADKTRMNLGLK